jgi:predicted DNA-binding WGR domain protein
MSRREFHFQEGDSSKFWVIEVDGPRFTVRHGRLGSAGQTQTKEFKTDAEAKKAADKLIAEKTKKGYAEVSPGQTPPAAPPRKGEAKEAPAPAAPPAEPAALEITRHADVAPPAWLRLPGQPWQCRPRPAPPPFDANECLARLRRVVGQQVQWRTDWDKLRIAPALTPPEARFWLAALTRARQGQKFTELEGELGRLDHDAPLTADQIMANLLGWEGYGRPELALPLSNLLTLEQYIDLIKAPGKGKRAHVPNSLLAGFREYVLPYVTADEAERLRARIRPYFHPIDTTDEDWYVRRLAAYLAMYEELRLIVAGWKDGELANYYSYSQDCWDSPHVIVFNLPDSRLVEAETRRLGLWLPTADAVAAWIVHTQWHDLDVVRDSILRVTQKDRAEKLIKVLARVRAPEAAPVMLQLAQESKAPGLARQWLDDNAGNAIAGLVPMAGERGKLADVAIEYLRDTKRRGAAEFIEEQLKSAHREAAERVRQEVLQHEEKVYEVLTDQTTPAWLSGALAAAPAAGKYPSFADPARLPPLLVEGRRLSDAQVASVLAALRASGLGAPHTLLSALKQHADRLPLDAFAWRLFEQWLADGAPSKEKWAFLALGHLGGDAVALKLTPLVRAWPGESQHQRAVTGLECLRAIGTDTALTQLNGIAQKLKFKGLQNRACEFMEAIAKDRGLTREQLEDRIVPDLDLDQRGGRTFDFGPRQFRAVLGPDLRPLVRDEQGKLREDLPKPGAKDDAARARAAVAAWKVLKKALREAVKVQAFRLEQAMVVGRRWAPDEFRTLLVHHPLMVNLVRRLLWGGYNGKGQLARTFRVTEEGEYADADDRPCTLEKIASVGVAHPLHLSEQERARWGEVLADYEIIAPFPQLGRPTYSLEGAEARATEITRFAGKKVPAPTLWGTLERLGWARGVPQDAGVVHDHSKSFPAAGVTAVLGYEIGIPVGAVQDWEDQQLKGLFFVESAAGRSWWYGRNQALPLGQVDAVAVSEVLADLTFLASKAE